MNIRKILLLPLIMLTITSLHGTDKTCVLKGVVVNRESKALLLVKSQEDVRYMAQRIPIMDNNTFEYILSDAPNIRYSLIFEDEFRQGAFMPIYFFPDGDTIYFTLYPNDQYAKNTIVGSEATEEILIFEKDVRLLFEHQFNAVNQQLDSLFKIKQQDSELAKYLSTKSDSISRAFISWRMNEIETKMSIAKYALLTDLISAAKHITFIDRNYLSSIVNSYQMMYPDHYYTELSKNLITALTTITVGGKFVNFKTVDQQGVEIEIAEYIKGNKITILDLWAPWCGPCRKRSRELIPLYENYKDNKLAIIGVVGGIKNIKAYNTAIEQENFPWKNYLEVNNQNKIWEKYNISNAGGGVFVIDKQGTILAIDPDIKDLEKILIDNLLQ
jgi:thiol-disulfide isomerase/thioredoxin